MQSTIILRNNAVTTPSSPLGLTRNHPSATPNSVSAILRASTSEIQDWISDSSTKEQLIAKLKLFTAADLKQLTAANADALNENGLLQYIPSQILATMPQSLANSLFDLTISHLGATELVKLINGTPAGQLRIPVKVATCSNPNLPLIPAESSPPIPVGVVASENQPNFD